MESPLPQPEFKTLVMDALQNDEPLRRDRALARLIEYAEKFAATRDRAHAESVALSAVAYVQRRAASGELCFETEAELLGYLKQVALGKAVTQLRKDRKHLGEPGARAVFNDPASSPFADRGAGPLTLAGDLEAAGNARAWLARYPKDLHRLIAERAARILIGPGAWDESSLFQLEQSADGLAAAFTEVLGLFPEQLRARASKHFAEVTFDELATLLPATRARLLGARSLKPRDRLIVEMREAGWSPSDIAGRLGMQPGNVRVVHKRACDRVSAAMVPSVTHPDGAPVPQSRT